MIAIGIEGNTLVVKATGRFDLDAAEQITKQIRPYRINEIIISMIDVTLVYASALSELLKAARGTCKVYVHRQGQVRELVYLIGADPFLENFTDEMEKKFAAVERQLTAVA